jgi:Zn-dependent peptidase ImmA (M78 family)/predicted secreted protein
VATALATAIRKGTLAAARLHQRLGTRGALTDIGGNVDVFEALVRVGLPHLLKPLDGLLGAYINEPTPGVLVTTQRPLAVQRFTAAHELGHFMLDHSPSLDDEGMLRRSPFGAAPRWHVREVEANAFAASFLMPRWLVQWHCERQEWTVKSLRDPLLLYQLSLRLGASYQATCWTLQQYGLLAASSGNVAREREPREIKAAILADYHPSDYRGDVWRLTERDAGTRLEGSRNDLFVLELTENSGAGYLWDFERLKDSGFVILRDAVESADDESVGGPVVRRVTASGESAGRGSVTVDERQPWTADPALQSITLHYDLTGPEPEGMSRAERRQLLAAA